MATTSLVLGNGARPAWFRLMVRWHAATELLAWVLHRRQRRRVEGQSMEPTLRPGDFVLVHPKPAASPVGNDWVGRVVVARHPHQDLDVIKRVTALTADGRVILSSDNPAAGTDSRTWGPILPTMVVGRVTLNLTEPKRSLTVTV